MQTIDPTYLPFIFKEKLYAFGAVEAEEGVVKEDSTNEATPSVAGLDKITCDLLLITQEKLDQEDITVWEPIQSRLGIDQLAIQKAQLKEEKYFDHIVENYLTNKVLLVGGFAELNKKYPWYTFSTLSSGRLLAVPSFKEMKMDRATMGKSSWEALKKFLG